MAQLTPSGVLSASEYQAHGPYLGGMLAPGLPVPTVLCLWLCRCLLRNSASIMRLTALPRRTAIVGRVANRIAKGKFMIGEKGYKVTCNDNGKNSLHGGAKGFDKKIWNCTPVKGGVELTLRSPAGDGAKPLPHPPSPSHAISNESMCTPSRRDCSLPSLAFLHPPCPPLTQTRRLDRMTRRAILLPAASQPSPAHAEGYPGTVDVVVRYILVGTSLEVTMTATCDSDTPVNLAQHSYFNLAGHDSGSILGCEVMPPPPGRVKQDGE